MTNNNLEATGLLMHYIALEAITDLTGEHVVSWCNKSCTVSWMCKGMSNKSKQGQCIIQALMLCLMSNKVSPLVTISIPGIISKMANHASCSFPSTIASMPEIFLTLFAHTFPLPQDAQWCLFQSSTQTSSFVCSKLQLQ